MLTPYDDVNEVLDGLLTAVSPILGDQFIGLYLTGSLASGGFNPGRSDIDFIVATADDLPDGTVAALAAMHARLRANGSYWAARLEGDYVPLAALRRHDPAKSSYPHLGDDGHFDVEGHDNSMVIQFHILREQGMALAGPPPHTLIDPIPPDALRQAMGGMLATWKRRDLTHPARQANDYQVYAILTMCRIMYTLRFGAAASKSTAAKWAIGAVDGRFHPLIQQADAWQNGMPFDKMTETLDFIGYTLTQSAKYEEAQ
ncbi:MAG: DUF4111 domain-containing protein [Chloroflexi bacterium]|nr:DUF4111 domain-containing protein [Chloroflexota bacterium]